MNKIKRAAKSLAFIACLIAIPACTPRIKTYGYAPSAEELTGIEMGVDTRETVVETVGPPSMTGVRSESGLYYVASRVRIYGPKRPEVISREVIAISFDQRGVVRNIERFGLEDGVVVTLERRVTESNVENRGLLRQLLGNIGNFNPSNIPSASN